MSITGWTSKTVSYHWTLASRSATVKARWWIRTRGTSDMGVSLLGRVLGGVVEEHPDNVLGETDPAIATRIVGNLLVDQTGRHGCPQIDVPPAHPVAGEVLAGELEGAHGGLVRL